MSECEGQFDDADASLPSELTENRPGSARSGGYSEEIDSMDSEDEEWDTFYGDEDICADFEEETKDFTKKLNAARGAGGLPAGQRNKKGASLDKTGSALQLSKSIQVKSIDRVHVYKFMG